MILKNYWKWLEIIQKTNIRSANILSYNAGLVDINGSVANIALATAYNDYGVLDPLLPNYNLIQNIFFRIGAGDTEVTSNDYMLDDDITDNIANLSINYSSQTDDNISRIISISGNNTSNEPITITKVAIGKGIVNGNNSTLYDFTTKNVLFAIHELEEPIVVQPNNNFNLIVEWVEQ